MISFFRRIRKGLADDNQILKYGKYALGEIVLVVIGILIALQINNWNIEKEDRVIEQNLLKNIASDLHKDLAEYKTVKDFKSDQNEAILWLLSYFIDASKPLQDTTKFINSLQLTMYFIIPSANHSSFDLGTSTGNLVKISDEQLIADLSSYFENIQLEQHLTETKRFTNAYMENNLLKVYPMYSSQSVALDGQGGSYQLERYKNDKRPIYQIDKIRRDIALENFLNNLSLRLVIGIKGLEKEMAWANRLIDQINTQLNAE